MSHAVFAIAPDGEAMRLAVSGEIDLATAPQMQAALKSLAEEGAAVIVVDMGALEFIDASGIGVLLSAAADARAQGHRLVLARVPPLVRRILELVGGGAELLIE